MKKNNIEMLTINDKTYPQKLRHIYDSPAILYYKGNKELFNKKSIAMVGCRNCTTYGKQVALKISYELSKQDICIISGMARGIDSYSHMGGIKEKGKTIAVIANGLDQIYPKENETLYKQILEKEGLIVSEYVIGTKPDKYNFPARNRIISGISDGVIVVEAKQKSGTLITVDFALEQGKDVFVIPRKYYKCKFVWYK